MGKAKGKTNKFPAMITYIVAVLCLLAGLLLPLTAQGFGGTDDIPAMQIPGAIDAAFGTNLSEGAAFPYQYLFFRLFGLLDEPVNIYVYLILAYALITALGVIALIPVCAGKRNKGTALAFASVIEVLALIVLAVFFFGEFVNAYFVTDYAWKWNMVIAAGGTLLMLILQAFIYKRGSGFIKFFLLLLSAVSVLALFGFGISETLGKFFAELSSAASFPTTKASLAAALTNDLNAIDNVVYLFYDFSSFTDTSDLPVLLLNWFTVVLGIIVLLNFLLDMIGLGKKTNKFMLVCNLIRYIIEFVALIGITILILVNGLDFGLMLIVIGAVAVIQLVIEIVRLCIYSKAKAKAKAAAKSDSPVEDEADFAIVPDVMSVGGAAEYEDEVAPVQNTVYIPTPVPVQAPAPAPAPAPVPAPAPAPVQEAKPEVETRNVIYNVNTIYHGPTDSFIKTLSNDEKVEFAKVFLERSAGNLPNIPDYVVGGDNKKFFSSVFIYFGRIRDLVSDGLMNKLYEQVNAIH